MFALSSKFYRFSTKLYQLICLNLLIVLVSLPIVTIGAGISAAIKTELEESTTGIWRPFFRFFKAGLIKTLPIVVFNLFSVFFIISLNNITLAGSVFLQLTKLLFISFIISYNVNAYVIEAIFDNQKMMTLFRLTFMFTLGTFFKTCFFPLIIIGLVYAAISAAGYMTFLFIVSVPVTLYLRLIKKEVVEITKKNQLTLETGTVVNEGA